MKNSIKALISTLPLLAYCGGSKNGIQATYKYSRNYNLSYTVGGEEELADYLALVELEKEADIATYIDEDLIEYKKG